MSRSLLLRFYFQLVARRPGSVIPGNQNNDWKGGTGESTAGLFTIASSDTILAICLLSRNKFPILVT